MPKVPAPPTPVNRQPQQSRGPRPVRRVLPIAALAVTFVATTGGAAGPGSSQIELIIYSLGSALALIMAIKIVIKLFVYIVQTAAVLAVLGLLYVLGNVAVNAVSGS